MGQAVTHSFPLPAQRDYEKREIIRNPVKAPLGIGAKERGIASSV